MRADGALPQCRHLDLGSGVELPRRGGGGGDASVDGTERPSSALQHTAAERDASGRDASGHGEPKDPVGSFSGPGLISGPLRVPQMYSKSKELLLLYNTWPCIK